jgi:hypothetical protein
VGFKVCKSPRRLLAYEARMGKAQNVYLSNFVFLTSKGAMAYQGVLAYFYDQIYPGHSVELNVCRWNQVVADVLWRGPNEMQYEGQCRDHPADGDYQANTPANGKCEDCRVVPVEETMTVHYTACKKPWDCMMPKPRVPGQGRREHTYRLKELTNVTVSLVAHSLLLGRSCISSLARLV